MVKAIAVPSVRPGEHGAPITDVAVRSDGRMLATASYDGTVLVWDVLGSGAVLPRTTFRHRRLVNGVCWNPRYPDLVASASADKTAAVWHINQPDRPRTVLGRHTDDINSIAWLPDGQHVVCVSEDGTGTIWDGLAGRFLGTVASHAAHCMDVAISHTGLIATVGEDGLITVSRLADGADVVRVASRQYSQSIEACSWSASGDRLALASDDGCVYVLDLSLTQQRAFPVSTSAVRSVAWRDEDRQLVVGAYDGRVYFLDSETGDTVAALDNPQAWPRSLSCAGEIVVVGSFSGIPLVVRPGQSDPDPDPMRHRTFGPNALASDGMALFIGCDSGTVFRVPIVGPGELDLDAAVMLELSGSPILSLAVTHDRIFAGTYGGQVLRRSDTGELKQVMLGAPVPSLALHNGGLTAGTYGGEIVALDSELGIRSRRTAHAGSVKSLAAGPAGWLLSAATDRRVAASRTGQQRILWEHGNLVNSIAYADGYVVSASRDHTVKVASMRMDAEQCRLDEPPLTLLGPDESVKCVSLLGDGDQIVVLAGSYDFSLWAWRIPIGNARRAVDQLQAGVPLAQFDQAVSCLCRLDSETAVAASWDGTLQVIQLRSGVPVAVARHALRDALRPAEVRL